MLKPLERTSIAPQISATSAIFVNTKPQTIFRVIGISVSVVCFLIAQGSNSAPTKGCPLPPDYGLTSPTGTTTSGSTTTTANTDTSTKSPEKGPGPLKAVCHHPTPDNSSTYIILCLPPNAYNAHVQHGDPPIASYVCTKEGNQGRCGP